MEQVRPLAEARGVTLQLVIDTTKGSLSKLRCDPAALARGLGNFLENAVQASPGGEVTLRAEGAHGGIRIEVDNEPGEVPQEIRARLFERAATSRHGEGSGLGLAIARAAIEAHGGRVRFRELGPPRVVVEIELPR